MTLPPVTRLTTRCGWRLCQSHTSEEERYEEGVVRAGNVRGDAGDQPARSVRPDRHSGGTGSGTRNHEDVDHDRRHLPADRAGFVCTRRSLAAWTPTSSGRTSGRGPTGSGASTAARSTGRYYDDGYNPANTVQLTNQLVLQDKVFAIVGTLGTEPNIPIRPLLNQRKDPAHPRLDGGELLGPPVQAVPVDDRLAARLHRDGDRVRAMDRPERPEREDRRLLPERRLREGLPQGPEDRPRGEADAHRLGARLRDHGHELRLTDRTAEGIRRRHLGAADDCGSHRARDRDGEGARTWRPDNRSINTSLSNTDSVMQRSAARSAAPTS